MRFITKYPSLHIGFIVLLPFALFWRWALKGEVLYWGTLLLQFWPWQTLVKTSWLNGEWPLWNPLLGNGTPLLANLQSAVFYPPNLIYLLLPVEHALTLSIVLHLMMAGVFMYLYGRSLGLRPFAATVSALAFMFSGYIVGRTQFVPMVNAAAWVPLILLLGDKLAARSGGIYIVWLGLALAAQLLAGHAQLWFYSLWLLGPYVIFISWRPATLRNRPNQNASYGSRFASVIKAGGLLILAVGLAVFVSAAQILPTAEFVQQSLRGAGAERAFALTYSFWPWRLITLLAPNFFGHPAHGNYWGYANYWEDHAYAGVLPVILALAAIWRYLSVRFAKAQPADAVTLAGPMAVVPFFAALIPVTLVLAMGWNTPVYLWVFETIPGFGYFQAPARLLIWYAVSVAVLAGIGAEQFQLTYKNRTFWRRLLAACIALAAAGVMAGWVIGGRSLTFLTATRQAGMLLVVAVGLLLLKPATQSLRKTLGWQWAVIIFISADLLLAGWPLLPSLPAALYRQPIASADVIKTQPGNFRVFTDEKFAYDTTFGRFFQFKDFGPAEDMDFWLSLKERLIPNFGVYANLPSANNNDPLVVGRWKQLTTAITKGDAVLQARLPALMNVGYIVGSGHDIQSTLYQTDAFVIKTIPDPLPRAYFVSEVRYVENSDEALAALSGPDFDPRREVVIMRPGMVKSPPPAPSSPVDFQPVIIQNIGPHRLQLRFTAPASGFIVLTDTFYPGWQAAVNNHPAEILPANLAFRAVEVEAGPHNVTFYYRPLSFTIGLWTSSITCLIIVVVIAVWTTGQYRKQN